MNADERELFALAVRKAMDNNTPDAALDTLGWYDALSEDRRLAVSTLFELQGERDATSSALDAVVTTAMGLPTTRIVLPAADRCDPPGNVDGNRLTVRGLWRGQAPDALHVVALTPDGFVVTTVSSREVDLRKITGMAPALDLAEVTGTTTVTGTEPIDWTAGVAAAQHALAHELVGTSRAMLQFAREHALDREQFGRPIASFQAVRHRLAEALVAVESAQSAADAAWHEPSPVNASLAKAVAGRSARIVARHAQQVLAGIGFTNEHSLHRYVRRALVLDGLFGSSRSLTHEIGAEALRTRQLPRPVAL